MICKFEELYQQEAASQRPRYQALREGFAKQFGSDAGGEYFSAPGRTEVGGNHTDHNHGRVLAAAVNLDAAAYARKTENGIAVLKSAEYPMLDMVDLNDLSVHPEEEGTSAALLRGVCARCKELGHKIGGRGLSAHDPGSKARPSRPAAFEVLIVTIPSHPYNDGQIDSGHCAAKIPVCVKTYFAPSGLLDQMASSVAASPPSTCKDPEAPVIEKVDFDISAQGYALCVVDTGGNHANLTGEYAAIPAEMKQVAAYFGKEFLQEVDEKEFLANISATSASRPATGPCCVPPFLRR